MRFLLPILLLSSCTVRIPTQYDVANGAVKIFPDYTEITIPNNIAPLNFRIEMQADEFITQITDSHGQTHLYTGSVVTIGEGDWAKILKASQSYSIDIYSRRGDKWTKYPTVRNCIDSSRIDGYITYRLIEPSYVVWKSMGLYERNLTNFDERPLLHSPLTTDNQCMNCHTPQNNDGGNRYMFHIRGKSGGGTIIADGDKIEKLNLKTDKVISGGVYPAFHPIKKEIAFSVNDIGQLFHTQLDKKVEVMDFQSDIMLYDIDKHTVTPLTNEFNKLYTFPAWSADGEYLYFCVADAPTENKNDEQERFMDLYRRYREFQYSLCRGRVVNNRLTDIDTIFSRPSSSVSFPRASADGRYLMFTLSDWGNFSIWHPEADLWITDLSTMESAPLEGANSEQTESFHSFSSGDAGWFVFSSRREDGNYTRLYISKLYNGKATKPFIIPQSSPDFYDGFFKSYNVPELSRSAVRYSAREMGEVAQQDAINVK